MKTLWPLRMSVSGVDEEAMSTAAAMELYHTSYSRLPPRYNSIRFVALLFLTTRFDDQLTIYRQWGSWTRSATLLTR
jgi:hypothetical protein